MKRLCFLTALLSIIIIGCSEASNPSQHLTSSSYIRITVNDTDGDLYRYGCISLIVELQAGGATQTDTLMAYIGTGTNAAFLIEKRNYNSPGEIIRVKEICVYDFLFNEMISDTEEFTFNFGENQEKTYTINATNTERYWELLTFDRTYNLAGKKVLCIVGRDFDSSEHQTISNFLKYYGAEVSTASYDLNTYGHMLLRNRGQLAEERVDDVQIDMLIGEAAASDYDLIFYPGGRGPANMLQEYPDIIDFTLNAFNSGIIIGAICHGPLVLAEAGVLNGKNATGFHDVENAIVSNGGTYLPGEAVVIDGSIITANWPNFNTLAHTFAEILENL